MLILRAPPNNCCNLSGGVALNVWFTTNGISDRNKMVLWPGCEGRAEFSLHTTNVRSVRFVVKRRGYCCNLSGSVVLNVWFTTNGMCVKKNTIFMWRKQAVIERSRQVISIVACCHGAKLCAHAARDFRSQHHQVDYCVLDPFEPIHT